MILTSGPIENSPINGTRETQQITALICNRSSSNTATIRIKGVNLTTIPTTYVLELFNVAPSTVIKKIYNANFNIFEFIFTVNTSSQEKLEISVWGKSKGQLVDAHRIVLNELTNFKD